MKNVKKILALRIPNFKFDENYLWLDRLTNGLVSQAAFKEYFSNEDDDKDTMSLFSFLPKYSAVDAVLLWNRARKEFPWNQILEMYPNQSLEVFYWGEFSDKEIERTRSYFDHFRKWSAVETGGVAQQNVI